MAATERDARHLERTLELAARARGRTSPNPLVGAVVVKNGRTIGEGFHEAAGEPHAERAALAECSEDPAGATLYVSLEPCAHEGRTPPCTEAIVEAGIARVVIASDDPTPKASGRGLGILRDEGIEVNVQDGALGNAARLLNQPFRKHARTGRPLVVLKSAMTLDGKVATRTGDSQWISGESSRARAHRWRAESDAVAVGIGTALADDPLLTCRLPGMHSPIRVVLDGKLRLPLASRLVASAKQAPLWVVTGAGAPRDPEQALVAYGAEVLRVPSHDGRLDLAATLKLLAERGITRLMVEAGPILAAAFLRADLVDEAALLRSPIAIGPDGIDALDELPLSALTRSPRLNPLGSETIGADMVERFERA
jgi:diaminohydroxyphosphoribosylaminopyrimidine deaminase / 5-amino-6-(5-phosphoribosylamino)uracil reductase